MSNEIIDDGTAPAVDKTGFDSARYRYFTVSIAIIGSLLIASGIGLFASLMWQEMPRTLQLAVAALPWLAGAVSAFYTFTSRPTLLWKEISALLNFAGLAIFTFIVLYSYNAVVPSLSLMTVGFAAAAVLAYIFSSGILILLYCAALFLLLTEPAVSILYCTAVFFVPVPFIVTHLKNSYAENILIRYAALLAAVFAVITTYTYYPALILTAAAALMLMGGWELYQKKTVFAANPWLFAGFAALLYIFGAGGSCKEFFTVGSSHLKEAYWLVVLLFIAALLVVFPRRVWDVKRCLTLLLVPGMALPLWHDVAPLLLQIGVSAAGVLLGITLIVNGIRKLEFILFNGGLLIFAVLTGCHFLDPAIALLYRAAGVSMLGVLFIIANLIFILAIHLRQKKLRRTAETGKTEEN